MLLRYALLLLAAAALVFLPAVVLGFLGLLPPGGWSEVVLLSSFVGGLALVVWMLVACIRDPTLDAKERLRWELLLILGGPITALVYLHRKLTRS